MCTFTANICVHLYFKIKKKRTQVFTQTNANLTEFREGFSVQCSERFIGVNFTIVGQVTSLVHVLTCDCVIPCVSSLSPWLYCIDRPIRWITGTGVGHLTVAYMEPFQISKRCSRHLFGYTITIIG